MIDPLDNVVDAASDFPGKQISPKDFRKAIYAYWPKFPLVSDENLIYIAWAINAGGRVALAREFAIVQELGGK